MGVHEQGEIGARQGELAEGAQVEAQLRLGRDHRRRAGDTGQRAVQLDKGRAALPPYFISFRIN